MKTAFALAVFAILVATPVLAQPADERVRLSVGGGLTAGAVDGEPSISASAGYRFAKNFSFEVEFTATEGAANRFPFPYLTAGNVASFPSSGRGVTVPPIQPNVPQLQNVVRIQPIPNIFPIPIEGFDDDDGSTLMTTAGFRFEFPVEGTRFRPYANAGMGLARTEQQLNYRLATGGPSIVTGPGGTVVSSSVSSILPRFDDDFSHTGMMLSAGVGASLRVWQELSVDLNARYYRLDRGRNLGSFGGGVSYRF